jgi:hypothetical protein
MRLRRLLPDVHLVAVVAHRRVLGDGGVALMALTSRRVAQKLANLAGDRRQLGKHIGLYSTDISAIVIQQKACDNGKD